MKYADAHARAIARALEALPVPAFCKGITLDELERDDENSFAFDGATAWLDNYRDYFGSGDEAGRGLLFYGPPGTGKTVMACAVLQSLVGLGAKGYFIRADTWRNTKGEEISAQQAWSKFHDEGAYDHWLDCQERLKVCRRAHVLVMDDVGTETSSDYTAKLLTELLRHRFNKGRPTILTSNVHPGEWGLDYGPATGSFIEQAAVILPVAGADRRIR